MCNFLLCSQALSKTVTWSGTFSVCPSCWGISAVIKVISKGAAPSSLFLCECHATRWWCFSEKGNEVSWLLWGCRVPFPRMHQHFVRKSTLCVAPGSDGSVATSLKWLMDLHADCWRQNLFSVDLRAVLINTPAEGYEIVKSWRKN